MPKPPKSPLGIAHQTSKLAVSVLRYSCGDADSTTAPVSVGGSNPIHLRYRGPEFSEFSKPYSASVRDTVFDTGPRRKMTLVILPGCIVSVSTLRGAKP